MNIRFLETVIWLARLRTMRAVSDKLHVSQTGVSSRIEAVEEELGVRLFVRDETGYTPTEEGIQFLQVATRIVDSYVDIQRRLRSHETIKGSVRLGMVPALAHSLLPGFMRQLQQTHPFLRLEVRTERTSRMLLDVQGGRLDLALCVDDAVAISGVQRIPLLSLSMIFVASPVLGVPHNRPLSVDELLRYPIIGYTTDSSSEKQLTAYLAHADTDAATMYRSNALDTMVHMAVSGLGIAPVPALVVQHQIDAGLLQVVSVVRPLWQLDYQIAYPAGNLPPAVSALLDLAVGSAESLCSTSNPSTAWTRVLDPV